MRQRYLCFMVILFLFAGTAFYGLAGAAVFNVSNQTELTNAINTAESNGEDDTINLAAGTYNLTSFIQYFSSENFSITFQGAGAGSTILDGGTIGDDIMSVTTATDVSVIIRGITFQNAVGTLLGSLAVFGDGDVTIENCEFLGNDGAVNIAESASLDPTITVKNNIFRGNSIFASGALSITANRGTLIVSNNTFDNNTVDFGGGIDMFSFELSSQANPLSVDISNNTFSGNSVTSGGGAINYSSTLEGATINIRNNIFAGNSAGIIGGGIDMSLSSNEVANITNNSFSGNIAPGVGSSIAIIMFNDNATANVYNNIAWDSAQDPSDQIRIRDDGEVNGIGGTVNSFNNDYESFTLTGVQDNFSEGDNIINKDPKFTDVSDPDPANWDLHIQASSPAEDSGLNTAPGIPTTDIDGETRIGNGTVDMGADELPASSSQIGGGGGGGCTIVDSRGSSNAGIETFSFLLIVTLWFAARRRNK